MKIVIPGEPVSQIRMKYSGRHGIGRIFDPREKQKRHIKAFISTYVKQFYIEDGSFEMFQHPRVSFVFHLPIPKSIRAHERKHYHSGLLKHEKKPDIDNFVKLYLDCLDGIVFDGDQKISQGPAIKLYHPFPKTIIIINETTELLSPVEVDPMTWFALYGKECGKCSSSEMDSLADFYTPDYLEFSLSNDTIFPRQTIGTSEPIPFVPQILAQAEFHLQQEKIHKANGH